jgi:hypothetical protein
VELTAAQIAELKEKYPAALGEPDREFIQVDTERYGSFVIMLPQSVHYAAFRQQVLNAPQNTAAIVAAFVRGCIVSPSAEDVGTLFKRRPLLVDKCFDRIKEELGESEQTIVKKL